MQQPTFHRLKLEIHDPFFEDLPFHQWGLREQAIQRGREGGDTECWNVDKRIAAFGSLSAIFNSLVSKPMTMRNSSSSSSHTKTQCTTCNVGNRVFGLGGGAHCDTLGAFVLVSVVRQRWRPAIYPDSTYPILKMAKMETNSLMTQFKSNPQGQIGGGGEVNCTVNTDTHADSLLFHLYWSNLTNSLSFLLPMTQQQ